MVPFPGSAAPPTAPPIRLQPRLPYTEELNQKRVARRFSSLGSSPLLGTKHVKTPPGVFAFVTEEIREADPTSPIFNMVNLGAVLAAEMRCTSHFRLCATVDSAYSLIYNVAHRNCSFARLSCLGYEISGRRIPCIRRRFFSSELAPVCFLAAVTKAPMPEVLRQAVRRPATAALLVGPAELQQRHHRAAFGKAAIPTEDP